MAAAHPWHYHLSNLEYSAGLCIAYSSSTEEAMNDSYIYVITALLPLSCAHADTSD
jgi:hypothetical protein